jgi:hypothetical protein
MSEAHYHNYQMRYGGRNKKGREDYTTAFTRGDLIKQIRKWGVLDSKFIRHRNGKNLDGKEMFELWQAVKELNGKQVLKLWQDAERKEG